MPKYTLTSPRARSAIPVSDTVTYAPIHKGLHLGYRRRDAAKPGSWLVRINRNGKTTAKTLGTADDGKLIANGSTVLNHQQASVAAQARTGTTSTPQRGARVADAMESWLDWKLEAVTNDNTAVAYRSDARVISKAFDCTIASLSHGQILDWHKSFPTPNTGDRKLATLKAALNRFAGKDGLWKDVSNHPPKMTGHIQPKPFFVLSPEDEVALLAASDEPFRRFLILSLHTGARTGELVAVKIKNLDHNDLYVDGKTGPRRVRLSAAMAEQARIWAGNRPVDDHLLVRADGSPWIKRRPRTAWKKYAAIADIPKNLSPYCTRHTFVTRKLAAGNPAIKVAQHVGTSLKHLQRNYAHFIDDGTEDWLA